MATKKAASSTPKKAAVKSADEPKPAAKKAAAKKAPATEAPATEAVASKLSGKKNPPTPQEISELAHKYWQERGSHHGSHVNDWLRAEKDLQS